MDEVLDTGSFQLFGTFRILYNPKDMVPSDVATMAIGQGIAVTPLQMLRAICAIANGGSW